MEKSTKWREICFLAFCVVLSGVLTGIRSTTIENKVVLGAEVRDSVLPVLLSQNNPNLSNEAIKKNLAELTKEFIRLTALVNGVDPQIALFIAEKESRFDFRARGDLNGICKYGPNKGKPQVSRGIWQFNNCSFSNISDAEAFDVASSTALAMEQMKKGNYKIWSVYRWCREWFEDCPFNKLAEK